MSIFTTSAAFYTEHPPPPHAHPAASHTDADPFRYSHGFSPCPILPPPPPRPTPYPTTTPRPRSYPASGDSNRIRFPEGDRDRRLQRQRASTGQVGSQGRLGVPLSSLKRGHEREQRRKDGQQHEAPGGPAGRGGSAGNGAASGKSTAPLSPPPYGGGEVRRSGGLGMRGRVKSLCFFLASRHFFFQGEESPPTEEILVRPVSARCFRRLVFIFFLNTRDRAAVLFFVSLAAFSSGICRCCHGAVNGSDFPLVVRPVPPRDALRNPLPPPPPGPNFTNFEETRVPVDIFETLPPFGINSAHLEGRLEGSVKTPVGGGGIWSTRRRRFFQRPCPGTGSRRLGGGSFGGASGPPAKTYGQRSAAPPAVYSVSGACGVRGEGGAGGVAVCAPGWHVLGTGDTRPPFHLCFVAWFVYSWLSCGTDERCCLVAQTNVVVCDSLSALSSVGGR